MDDKRERLARALRDNLRRRKAVGKGSADSVARSQDVERSLPRDRPPEPEDAN